MKIEVNNSHEVFFKDIKVGETFYENEILFIRIEVDDVYTNAVSHDGLGISLETGHISWFDAFDTVTKANVKVVDA